MLRVAKLAGPAGEVPCIVRDISATGTRLRLFSDQDLGDHLFLELANGRRFAMQRMWQAQNHAGFRFAEEVDVGSFVSEHGTFPKRGIRLRTTRPAELACHGAMFQATLRDVSQQGAQLVCDAHLAIAQRVTVKAQGMPERQATVRWRRSGAYGVVFEKTLPLRSWPSWRSSSSRGGAVNHTLATFLHASPDGRGGRSMDLRIDTKRGAVRSTSAKLRCAGYVGLPEAVQC